MGSPSFRFHKPSHGYDVAMARILASLQKPATNKFFWVVCPGLRSTFGGLTCRVSFVVPEPSEKLEQSILLVEDNQDDILLILRAFQRSGTRRRIQVVKNGSDAISYLKGDPPFDDRKKYPVPGLMLLDIKMPGIDGFEVLKWIRSQWEFFQLCVVMLTSSDLIRDVNQAYHLGANSFLVKPLDFQNAAELARSLDTLMVKDY